MIVSKQQNTKNKLIIFKLVKKHFSLRKDSLKVFKQNLFYEQDSCPEYKFIDDCPDKRFSIDVKDLFDDSNLSEDEATIFFEDYNLFKNFFFDFCMNFILTYQDYKKNIITIQKNEYKLFKVVFKYQLIDLIKKFSAGQDFNLTIKSNMSKFKQVIEKTQLWNKEETQEDNTFKFYLNLLNSKIKYIIKNKQSKSSAKLVFSRNFTDYFMCSTKQSFSSCLSMNSDFSSAYYTGIPGLITDRNRAIVYLNKGDETVEYQGIVAPKMIFRSWLLLAKKQKESAIQPVRLYPGNNYEKILNLALEKLFKGFKILESESTHSSFVSKYNFYPIFQWNHCLSTIYLDTCKIKRRDKNKFFYAFKDGRDHYYLNEKGEEQSYNVNYGNGLNGLIRDNIDILQAESSEDDDRCSCDSCGTYNDVSYSEEADSYLCESCYNERFAYCSDCNDIIDLRNDSYREFEREIYCENCANDLLTTCYGCEETIRYDDTQEINGEIYCNNCARQLFTQCNECNELFLNEEIIFINGNYYCENCKPKEEETLFKGVENEGSIVQSISNI